MHIIRRHYPEYLMEAAGLGIFMISASMVTALVEHPASPVRQVITDPFLRRLIIGVAMGLTAIAIIYSPWGKQSGGELRCDTSWFRGDWNCFFRRILHLIWLNDDDFSCL